MADLKLFNIKGTVEELPSKQVTLEKELQKLLEDNMQTFFGVTFLKSEYKITNGRMDSIGIDENNCPVIFEYKRMLDRYEAVDEKQWQEKIHNILQLLYPKYICCAREIKFYGGKNDKQPDFLLVDANGFVDILEIKKADVRVLTQYRNNYVSSREISGAIQQIEKYIFCLNSSDKAKKDVSKKLAAFLPEGMEVKIINPQGILLSGRSNEFTEEQQKDFELIKRQYKHVVDIMTYDDLLLRLGNIIKSLKLKVSVSTNLIENIIR